MNTPVFGIPGFDSSPIQRTSRAVQSQQQIGAAGRALLMESDPQIYFRATSAKQDLRGLSNDLRNGSRTSEILELTGPAALSMPASESAARTRRYPQSTQQTAGAAVSGDVRRIL